MSRRGLIRGESRKILAAHRAYAKLERVANDPAAYEVLRSSFAADVLRITYDARNKLWPGWVPARRWGTHMPRRRVVA